MEPVGNFTYFFNGEQCKDFAEFQEKIAGKDLEIRIKNTKIYVRDNK